MIKLIITAFLFQLPLIVCSQQVDLDSLNKSIRQKKDQIVGTAYRKFTITANNSSLSNANFDRNVVFINFWYAACAPCMAEMNALNKLYDTFSANPNFKFISFTFEKDEQIREIKDKYGIRYPVFSISTDECERLNYNFGFPVNIILGDSGIVKYINPGASLNEQKNSTYFRKALYPIIAGELHKPNQ